MHSVDTKKYFVAIKVNMEVTRKNFEEVLSSLKEVFENAQFIAVDTEYTGLKVEGMNNVNYFDTLEDLFLKYRLRAQTFMAIQIGLVAFFYDNETKKYSHLGYNFYVYPSSYSNVNFTCQSTSIQFLVQHGFDFNKLFKEGIPYLKDDEAENLLERLREKYEKNYSTDNVLKLEVPKFEVSKAYKPVVNSIINKIQDILQSNKKETFITERFNSYFRKLIYNSVKLEFGSSVFLETNRNESMTISVGYSSDEIKEKQKERNLIQKNEILEEVGFSKVIKLLIESKNLLIGHNIFMDIMFIIKQFLVPLPDNYSEFKDLVKFLFPRIIDTKYMAGSEFKNIKNTSLDYLVEYFEGSESLPEVVIHENGAGYKLQDRKLHEASYDAYLTGLCFLAMSEYLGKVNCTSNIFNTLPESPILQPLLNKLSTPKLHDISFMNLGGLDNEPDRVNVYHLTFPEEWTREDILDLFKNCGLIHISWINSMSAFVKVDMEYIKEVENNLLKSNQTYNLLTYSKFKSLNTPSDDLPSSPVPEKIRSNDTPTPVNSYSPMKTNSENLAKKRKEEDLGEVIERPKKKFCSS